MAAPASSSTDAMEIKIRLYTTDIDLLSLYAAGYPLTDMIGQAVTAYAHGRPIAFSIDRAVDFDFNRLIRNRGGNRQTTTSDGAQAQMTVRLTDPKAMAFCRKCIKAQYRCKCLKMLLRYSLRGTAPIGAYLTTDHQRSACEAYFSAFEDGTADVVEVKALKPRRILADRIAEAIATEKGKSAAKKPRKRPAPKPVQEPVAESPEPVKRADIPDIPPAMLQADDTPIAAPPLQPVIENMFENNQNFLSNFDQDYDDDDEEV